MKNPAPNRGKTTYPIPSTDLTLHLTLGLDLPLPIACIRSCLNGALDIARSYDPLSLTPSAVVRFQQAEGMRDGDATFGIVGEVVFDCNELSWGDVVGALRGLGWWYDERISNGEEGIEIWFKLVEGGEEGRGQLGVGHLTRREVEEEGRTGVVDIGEGSSF